MAYQINIANREINPRVINFFTFENGVTTLEFTLDSYMYDEVDLRNYKAYAVTSIKGSVDLTELEMAYDEVDDKLKLTWNVGDYTLTETGAILYQITFKQTEDDGENSSVWYSYKAIMINRGSVDADYKIVAEYPTIMKQWLDKMDSMYGELTEIKEDAIADISKLAEDFGDSIIYIPFGEVEKNRIEGRLYYQWLDEAHTVGQFEDHLGNILIPDVDGLPEQTGMEGKYLTTDGETAYWMEAPRGLPLFGHIWSDHLFNDASYLRADTFSWHDGGVYVAAYNELEKEYTRGTEEVEGDIVFKRGENGYKICSADQEEAIANLYAITGVAWYYIIDTENKRFKLPRTKWGFVGLRDGVGGYVGESLPNISGKFVTVHGSEVEGAFESEGASSSRYGSTGTISEKVRFNASLSSSTYQDNAPVQQRATEMYLYFYVGNYFRTQTEINIGEMAEKVNSLKVNNPFYLGLSQYSEVDPNNDSWLKSDGDFHDGATYVSFYEWLLNNGLAKSVDETYDDYDYVINTADMTFRLPVYNGSESLFDFSIENRIEKEAGSAENPNIASHNCYVNFAGTATTADGKSCVLLVEQQDGSFGSTQTVSQNGGIIHSGGTQFLKAGTKYYVASPNLKYLYEYPAIGNGSLYFYVGETVVGANIIDYTKQLTEATEEALTAISTYQQPLVTIAETSGTVTLAVNNIYTMVISGDTTFTLPETVNTNLFNQIKVMAKIVGTPVITWGTSYFVNKSEPSLEEGCYDLYFDYDNHLAGWVVGAISKGA